MHGYRQAVTRGGCPRRASRRRPTGAAVFAPPRTRCEISPERVTEVRQNALQKYVRTRCHLRSKCIAPHQARHPRHLNGGHSLRGRPVPGAQRRHGRTPRRLSHPPRRTARLDPRSRPFGHAQAALVVWLTCLVLCAGEFWVFKYWAAGVIWTVGRKGNWLPSPNNLGLVLSRHCTNPPVPDH